MREMEITKLLEFREREELRRWLAANHCQEKECWVATYRRKEKPEGVCLRYLDVVEEALCFGWIDSTCKSMGDGRLAQRLSPRQKRSHWTALNRERCAELERSGLMTDAGRKAWEEGLENKNQGR